MGAVNTELVQEADSVDRHVAQRVRRHRLGVVELAGGEDADELHQVYGAVVDLGRQPAVTVVVADHVTAGGGQQPTEPGVPAEHLGPEAHHQQDRRIGRIPERFVLQLDATARPDEHLVALFRI